MAFSWAADCPADIPGATVFYGNGINRTKEDARFDRDRLEQEFKAFIVGKPIQDECLHPFDLAYDTDIGIRLQVLDSAGQILAGNMSVFWRFWGNLDVGPDWFQQLALETAMNIDQDLYVLQEDLQMHVQQYGAEFFKRNKIAVVAHSQGNLYANEAYNVLYNGASPLQTTSFGIVSVANPASFVTGDGPRTTFFGDIITLVPGALPPNTPSDGLGVCRLSPLCLHSFADAYLRGTVSRPQILQNVVDVISGLEFPPPEPEPVAWQEDFEGTVPIVMDSSTCHQDPEKYGYMSHASIGSGVAVSPTHSLTVRFENATTGGFCFGGFLGHLDTISAYVRISGETTNSQLVLVSQGAAAPPRGCMVKFNAGSIDAYTADFQHVQQLGTYDTETFYKIVFVVDLDNQSCRIAWADGALSAPIASDTQGAFHHWSQLFIGTSGAGVTMYIDDISKTTP